jgi:A/G-specific adenine glycosylase
MSRRAEPLSEGIAHIRGIRAPLLRWYDANARDLPWRRSRDPFAIWISEAMLQQTRVETVIPYWHAFLSAFPDVESLARAELDEIYSVWTGLGYYSRARNLKHAAQTIVAEYNGRLPETVSELRQLRGVGPYTAGAISSIAFGHEAPLVDGNVIRVFTRVFGIREEISSKKIIDRLWLIAETLVLGPRPGDFNQALMELGALLCTTRKPQCATCPIQKHCSANAEGDVEKLPMKKSKPKPKPMRAVAGWIERDGKFLIVRRPEKGLMAGLWELPGGEIGLKEDGKDRISEIIQTVSGLKIRNSQSAGHVEHLFTHRKLDLEIFRCQLKRGQRVRRFGYSQHRWVKPSAILKLAHAGPLRKAMVLLLITQESSARKAAKISGSTIS